MKFIGVAGMALAARAALVISEPKRQKDLVPRLTNDFGFYQENKGTRSRNFDIAWRDLKMICVKMIKLRSLWVLNTQHG
jgi:hypothetical protein